MKFVDNYMINSDTKRNLSETVFKLKGDLELGHKTLSKCTITRRFHWNTLK